MTIRLRILALLSLLSLFCVGTTYYFKRLHAGEEELARLQRVNALASRLQRLVSMREQPAGRYLHELSGSSGMADFMAKRDRAWAESHLRGKLDAHRIDRVWVLAAGGAVIYSENRAVDSAQTAALLPWAELQGILQKHEPFEFHEFIEGELYAIQGRPIPAAGADRQAVPAGWVIVAQQWGEQQLHDLAEVVQGYIALTGPTHTSDVRSEAEIEVWQPLLDHRGTAIAGLDCHVVDTLMENPAMEKIELTLFICNGAGAVILVALLMHFWILRPFSMVRASLVARDPAALRPLLYQRNEFGQMARVVQSSMRDREQLLQSQDERMRLARELHDGVIQSIYGTGMALSHAQSLMNRDLPAAQKLLDETREELNRIILDLRGHVEQADPKPLDTSFGAAVEQLIRQFHGAGPIRAKVEINEELVGRFPLLHRSQALQFVREAVSNAARHGHPSCITVSWQRTTEGSLLEIADDGGGFDPDTIQRAGHGLGNLSERAISLGGRLEIISRPDEGTRICLKLPISDISA